MGPWLLTLGVILIVAGIFIRPKEEPWEWSFIWGLAGNSTLLGKAVGVLGVIVLLIGGNMYLRGESSASIAPAGGVVSKPGACGLNCIKIESAKEQYALANNLKPGTVLTPAQVEQMGVYLQGGWSAIRCSAGGIYEVGKIGEPARCSAHGPKTTK